MDKNNLNDNMREGLNNINQDISRGVSKGADIFFGTSDLIKGVLAIAVGIILFTYSSFGWFKSVISPVLGLSGAILVFWGGLTANIYGRIKRFWAYLSNQK